MERQTLDIDAIRQEAILTSLAGFPFLLVFGFAWIAAAALSYVVPPDVAPWIYLLQGVPAMPVAIAIERRVGYIRPTAPSPLLSLTLQILAVQIVAFPLIMLVWDMASAYVPVAFAILVGAHFLPFQWVYRTRLYGVLGVVVAVGPYLLAGFFREEAMHFTGFFVGSVLLVGAFVARAHARATWREAQRGGRQVDPAGAASDRG